VGNVHFYESFPNLVGSFFIRRVVDYYRLTQAEEKLIMMRDPLFVINASIQIIKQRKSDEQVDMEIKRIQSALDKIGKIMQV
jgi:hypothetical protein